MRSANDAVMRIEEQDRRAIGRQYREGEARLGGDQAIAARPLSQAGRPDTLHLRPMHLVGRQQDRWAEAERCGHPAAIFRHRFGIILGAEASIERGVNASRYPALTPKKTVHDTRRVQRWRGEERRAQNPAGAGSPGLERQIT